MGGGVQFVFLVVCPKNVSLQISIGIILLTAMCTRIQIYYWTIKVWIVS